MDRYARLWIEEVKSCVRDISSLRAYKSICFEFCRVRFASSIQTLIRLVMFPRSYLAIAALSAIAVQGDIIHYPPRSTNVNNLTFAFNGTGAPGIFNSSVTPDNEYGIYNWCNMPHVRTREYK